MGNASCAGQLSRLRYHPVTHHHLAGRGPVLPQSGSRKPSACRLPSRPTHVLKVNWPPADAQRAALCPHALAGCPACLLSSHCVQFQTFPSIVNTDSIKTQPVRRSADAPSLGGPGTLPHAQGRASPPLRHQPQRLHLHTRSTHPFPESSPLYMRIEMAHMET